jgi:UrcA family protein
MKQTLRIIAVSALATAALIKGVPAFAEPAMNNATIVRTADLDLSSKAGQAQLQHRLVVAAHELCGTASEVDLVGRNDVRQCRTDVLRQLGSKSEALLAGRSSKRDILIAAR